MSSSSIKKPFFLKPPWNLLFEPKKLEEIQPWEVNISLLLKSFLTEMEKLKEVDFRASGVALDSSAAIFLLKSKLLLNWKKSNPSPSKQQNFFLPPPLMHPLRYELTTTTINQLLEALEEVLKVDKKPQTVLKQRLTPPLPSEILPPIDMHILELEEKMKEILLLLQQLSDDKKLIIFSKIIARMGRSELIKTFITLLFLAQKGEVDLKQEEEFGEIHITLTKGE